MGPVVLFDTCSLIWLVSDRAKLTQRARSFITKAPRRYISAISAFEIGTKHHRGKLELPKPPDVWWSQALERFKLIEVPVTAAIALTSTALPLEIVVDNRVIIHRDPGDRLIAATALTHELAVVTPDRRIAAYPGVTVLW